jgi:deoxyribodipyrimidine photo-lyase
MNKPYKLALHVFRRDLRLQDNTALIEALQLSEQVIPCFIFDTRQVGNNIYKSEACLQFMAASLKELDAALQKKNGRLFFFDGLSEKVIAALCTQLPIEAVFINRDYTPFSRERDQKIASACHKKGIALHTHSDALLHEPEACLKANNEPYTVFTPFFRRSSMLPVNPPTANRYSNYYQATIPKSNTATLEKLLTYQNPELVVKGGRQEGIQLLKKINALAQYETLRNLPAQSGTTHLSAHHKFGTISIREAFAMITAAFGPHHLLINELYWRDFFTHIGFHFPRVFGQAFHQKYDAIQWDTRPAPLQAWQSGMTGFPIVDAGMRELNTTGYMHNRVRMVVASFLTKDLHIDWRLGEQYFARQLVDYDPAVNNGNWQWSASTGCDAQPYFRIFNPWLQQKRFDPDCAYIKRWVPELAAVSASALHQLAEKPLPPQIKYPRPIVKHSVESQNSKNLYKGI